MINVEKDPGSLTLTHGIQVWMISKSCISFEENCTSQKNDNKWFYADLLQANRHEYIAEEQGLYTFLYRWVVILKSDSPADIQQLVANITHLAVLTPDSKPAYHANKCQLVSVELI